MSYLFIISILTYKFRISLDIPQIIYLYKRVLMVGGKRRCLIRVFILGSNIFLVNFCIKWPV